MADSFRSPSHQRTPAAAYRQLVHRLRARPAGAGHAGDRGNPHART
ncbi:hypothetical protein [Streptomyces sp. NBC_00388]